MIFFNSLLTSVNLVFEIITNVDFYFELHGLDNYFVLNWIYADIRKSCNYLSRVIFLFVHTPLELIKSIMVIQLL